MTALVLVLVWRRTRKKTPSKSPRPLFGAAPLLRNFFGHSGFFSLRAGALDNEYPNDAPVRGNVSPSTSARQRGERTCAPKGFRAEL